MDYTVHGILQARILEWVAVPFSRGSSQPSDQTQVSRIAGRFFTSWATRLHRQGNTLISKFRDDKDGEATEFLLKFKKAKHIIFDVVYALCSVLTYMQIKL